MTKDEIDEKLAAMTDEQVVAAFSEAREDLASAAATQPNSEWHEACFAGLLTFAGELSKRGIRAGPTH